MLYITTLHISEFPLALALATAVAFVVFSIVKEKCDERKRA
ncbi:hypothetical protein OR1_00373 [Geobacter sp. OR-1]|nr:hypothetical protein OR1_00373 [Geobacter sp. OR-1]